MKPDIANLSKRERDILLNPAEVRGGFEIKFVEKRNDANEEIMELEGYALKFNNQTLIGSEEYGFREVIDPKALDETDMKKVPFKYNHEGSYLLLASTKNGSLTLEVDEIGLKFKSTLINTSSNRDVYLSVKEGLLSECSFAFTLAPGGYEWDWEPDIPLRKITKISRLYDIAIVDIPAYNDTSVSARSLELFENNKRAFEGVQEQQKKKKLEMEMKLKLSNVGGKH